MNNQLFTAFIATAILLFIFLLAIIGVVVIQKNKQNKFAERTDRLNHLNELKILNIKAEEQERAAHFISKELHDHIGQVLGLMSMNLKFIGNQNKSEDLLPLIRSTEQLVTVLINDVKHMSHSLNNEYISTKGLTEILHREMDFINNSKSIRCVLDTEGTPYSLPGEKELIIYRIVQETTSNIFKHAFASLINIRISYQSTLFSIIVEDDGIGFDVDLAAMADGIGLSNIRERVKLLEGQLNISSSPGKGCRIRVCFVPRLQFAE